MSIRKHSTTGPFPANPSALFENYDEDLKSALASVGSKLETARALKGGELQKVEGAFRWKRQSCPLLDGRQEHLCYWW